MLFNFLSVLFIIGVISFYILYHRQLKFSLSSRDVKEWIINAHEHLDKKRYYADILKSLFHFNKMNYNVKNIQSFIKKNKNEISNDILYDFYELIMQPVSFDIEKKRKIYKWLPFVMNLFILMNLAFCLYYSINKDNLIVASIFSIIHLIVSISFVPFVISVKNSATSFHKFYEYGIQKSDFIALKDLYASLCNFQSKNELYKAFNELHPSFFTNKEHNSYLINSTIKYLEILSLYSFKNDMSMIHDCTEKYINNLNTYSEEQMKNDYSFSHIDELIKIKENSI